MRSTRHYRICICSVILGELESIRNYKGFSVIFPNILDATWRITYSLYRIFEYDNFRFPFLYEK